MLGEGGREGGRGGEGGRGRGKLESGIGRWRKRERGGKERRTAKRRKGRRE
jgi:hypothetical protein